MATITESARENYWATIMIISYDNDSLIFDMHIMSWKWFLDIIILFITQISIKYQNINSQTNHILSRYLINCNTATNALGFCHVKVENAKKVGTAFHKCNCKDFVSKAINKRSRVLFVSIFMFSFAHWNCTHKVILSPLLHL